MAEPRMVLAETLLAIARDALLDHLGRGDARHALRFLTAALSKALGTHCSVQALAGDGSVRWTEGTQGLDAAAPAHATALAVDRLGERVGLLWVAGHAPAAAQMLEPVLPTIAALLQHAAEPVPTPAAGAHMALIKAALAGADTLVWEWDLDSDWLGDIDTGLAQLGYVPGEVGQMQADWDRLIHPEDRAANDAAYQRHARGETDTYEHAYRVLAKDGRWRWVLERGRIVERHADGRPRRMLGTQTDITERRRMEQAASEATVRLQRVARQLPGLLYQYTLPPGERGRLTYISERGRELFGLTVDHVLEDIGALWRAVDLGDQRRMLTALRHSAAALTEWRCEFRTRRGDGQWRWMLGTATPERRADGVMVWYGYAEDVTDRRELEQARQDAAVADAANRAKTEFLSRMSHELRTPLNAVLGFAQLMEIDRAEPPAPGQQRRLRLIREAGEHLLQMIGDMLDLTRIEAGGMKLVIEPVLLRELAAQALEMVRTSADQARLSLALADGGAAVIVQADRTRLRQVLLNLLANAVKYNRTGGRVELRVSQGADGGARVDVSDTGVGIAEAELPRIFEPFQRGGQAYSSVEGAGIGLAVTRALVLLMGGRIQAASTPGVGSTFSVLLPPEASGYS